MAKPLERPSSVLNTFVPVNVFDVSRFAVSASNACTVDPIAAVKSAAISALTNAVVASCVVSVPCAAVGAAGAAESGSRSIK